MLNKIVHDALMIWVTIEPIGTVVLFAALTSGLSPTERRKTATRAIIYSAIVLLSAILVGQIILTAMHIQLISLQIAGGIILFLFGLQMIFGQTATAFSQSEAGHGGVSAGDTFHRRARVHYGSDFTHRQLPLLHHHAGDNSRRNA